MIRLDLDAESAESLFSAETRRWVVGFSGGLDSMVLLHLLANHPERPDILAVHINHGLQAGSESWASHCSDVCKKLHIAFVAITVTVDPSGSSETQARKSRYQAFEEVLQAHDVLVLAHHLDDQLETAFLNLLRGSDAPGLLGMPAVRRLSTNLVCRPLLGVAGDALKSYAVNHKLSWIEDPSNVTDLADRNFLRNQILPRLADRFPDIRSKLASGIQRDIQARQLLYQLARLDLANIQDEQAGISIPGLMQLGEDRAVNLLRTQLLDLGVALPSGKHLRQGLADMLAAEPDKSPVINLNGYEYRRFQGRIFLREVIQLVNWLTLDWPAQAHYLDIEELRITREEMATGGVSLSIDAPRLRLKQAGEVIFLGHNKKINDILREASVPSWIRSRLPVVVSDDQVVAVPAIPDWSFEQRVATPYAVEAGSPGWCYKVFFRR